jgi:hypothetical protein
LHEEKVLCEPKNVEIDSIKDFQNPLFVWYDLMKYFLE